MSAHSAKRLKTWQKATALVPLALLSGAWTANLTVPDLATAASERHGGTLPDGSSVPDRAIQAPASLTVPGEIAPGVPAGAEQSVVSSASTNGIPSAALAAYQRAAQVIDSADPTCHMPWQLIAAIGRVESDHGRYGGNRLGADGVSRPGIFGIPLDGSNGTARITDTDGGQYDGDPVYDRAVGPMQFIPSTWSVVGVDGDGDGRRNPQDIDDAALATAVYLCSGNENLATAAGREAAVYRYNHSRDYVNLVLSIMAAYASGDYSSVPNGAAAPTVIAPAPIGVGAASRHHKKAHPAARPAGTRSGGSTGGASGGSTAGSGSGSGGSTGSTGSTPSTGGTTSGTTDTVKKATDSATTAAGGTTSGATQTTDVVKTATDYCTSKLSGSGATDAQVQQCVDAYVSGGQAAADTVIASILATLGTVGGVLGD